MKRSDIDIIADKIARVILLEQELELSDDEKQKQSELAGEIEKADLTAEEGEEEDLEDLEEEEEEEEEVEVDIEAKPKPDDSATEEEADDSGEDFEVQAPDAIPQKIQYTQIEKQVNNLRAGKSLKDEKISKELQDYFKELGTGEKQALFTYLASISAILTGGTSGQDAPRPGNLNIEITPEKEEGEKKAKEVIVDDEVVSKDRSAPIVVGELADKYNELTFMFEQTVARGDPHRCMNGDVVPFGSGRCVQDLTDRISDAEHQRDGIGRGSADRSSLNGTLKYLRQKKRSASKISNQIEQEKLQARLNQADSE
tara:strand:+ start:373 stop:1311 length:939 start_codon:yes stop_codon:yes gene_type:complete